MPIRPFARSPRRGAARIAGITPLVVAALLAPVALAGPAAAATYRVGFGLGCTHLGLASAINAAAANPGPDEILLLAGTTHTGPYLIFTDGLALRGGFADCLAAVPSGRTTISGGGGNRPLFLALSGPSRLERLDLSGGSFTGNGGGLWIQGSAELTLDSVWALGNTVSASGGNVHVNAVAGLAVHFTGDTRLLSGTAQRGGGLSCAGPGLVTLAPTSRVALNTATFDGGGIHLSGGCQLLSQAGNYPGDAWGIVDNTAARFGGGVHVETGAILTTQGTALGPAVIRGNGAGAVGGGVFVTGAGSVFSGLDTWVNSNQATSAGGGLAADFGGAVALARRPTPAASCPNRPCSSLSTNVSGSGAALSLDGHSSALIAGTRLQLNLALGQHPVAYVVGGSALTLLNSLVTESEGPRPFYFDAAAFTLGNVTMARNLSAGSGLLEIGPGVLGKPIQVIESSLFDQEEPLFAPGFPGSTQPTLRCLLSRVGSLYAGLPPSSIVEGLAVGDPGFVSPALHDYRIRPDSAAIDRCGGGPPSSDNQDYSGGPRDVDRPDRPNAAPPGFRDAGAIELLDLVSDGFELGRIPGSWPETWPALFP